MRPRAPLPLLAVVVATLLPVGAVGATPPSGASSSGAAPSQTAASRLAPPGSAVRLVPSGADTLTWAARIARSRQQLVVVTPNRTSIQGRLFRFERGDDGWRRVGEPVAVVVGKSGVAPKHEGDGRSPMGVFDLGTAFGYASAPPARLRIAYRALSADTRCVDDVSSSHYAEIVDSSKVARPDWKSAEKMRRDLAYGDDLYRWGVVVRYNPDRRPGAGSCIFLHIWRNASDPTVGCTAMPQTTLLRIMEWLRPEDDPILVQGARRDLERLRGDGVLPFPVPD